MRMAYSRLCPKQLAMEEPKSLLKNFREKKHYSPSKKMGELLAGGKID